MSSDLLKIPGTTLPIVCKKTPKKAQYKKTPTITPPVKSSKWGGKRSYEGAFKKCDRCRIKVRDRVDVGGFKICTSCANDTAKRIKDLSDRDAEYYVQLRLQYRLPPIKEEIYEED